MGENSSIEWTHHTFNPWIGCAKVHEGCANCYAETMMDTRYGRVRWGVNGTRTRTSEAAWKQPLKWNREAIAADERRRVFCASLADVFEDRDELEDWRLDLFELIVRTPHLDWLLLTKRPENIRRMWPAGRLPHVLLGTSVSNQPTADKQIPELLECQSLCRALFLSVEPLLGPLDLNNYLYTRYHDGGARHMYNRIGWAIVGGESGPDARPMHPDWVRLVRDQCQAAHVPFFFKQWGEYCPEKWADPRSPFLHLQNGQVVANGRTTVQISTDLFRAERIGKKKAGRMLDGRTWDEYPDTAASGVTA